jgi:phospholipid-translocating ATPase
MSVIVRMHESSTHVILFCKGADSVIFERLSADGTSPELMQTTSDHLEMFANDGLRTLSLAYRLIPIEEYEEWVSGYTAALTSISDDRDALVDAAASRIECELKLMGATAIEDKLQDGVPESIALLSKAGIKIWVLTVCY